MKPKTLKSSSTGYLKPRPGSGKLDPIATSMVLPGERKLSSAGKRSSVLDRLESSPFLTKSETLDEMLMSLKPKPVSSDEKNIDTSAWELKLHAANVLGGRQTSKANKMFKKLQKKRDQFVPKVRLENQGPTDWSWEGLKCKYRGEEEREELWHNWQSLCTYSTYAFQTEEVVVPVAKVERHPLYRMFEDFVTRENNMSAQRTRKRLLMKRFVLDVQEIWLTNLQHLAEHNPSRILIDSIDSSQLRAKAVGNECDNNSFNGGEGGTESHFTAGVGGRRDVKAIQCMDHQIQSVAQSRALQQAYFTTLQPDPRVVLDYSPESTAVLIPPPPDAPTIESLISALSLKYGDWSNKNSDTHKCHQGSQYDAGVDGDDDVVLFIDRLLPSVDLRQQEETILWRIQIIERKNANVSCFTATESDLANYVASRMIDEAPIQQSALQSFDVYEGVEVSIPVEHSEEELRAALFIAVICKSLPCYEGPHSCRARTVIDIECRIVVSEGEYKNTELVCLTSPTELRSLLGIMEAPLDDVNWWCLEERQQDIWPALQTMLTVEKRLDEIDSDAELVLSLLKMKSPSAALENALTLSQAFACAHEIATWLSYSATQDPPLRLYGSSSSNTILLPTVFSTSTEVEESPNNCVSWELMADQLPCLSLQVNGGAKELSQVPGACEYGQTGIWLKPPHRNPTEFTRAAARFQRNPRISTSNTVFVLMTLALDVSVQFPCCLAWDTFSVCPPRRAFETITDCITPIAARCTALMAEPLVNPLQQLVSQTVMIFVTSAEEGHDYLPQDLTRRQLKGMKRHVPYVNSHGFRQKIELTLLGVDPVLPTVVFGITSMGAQPNVMGVNPRNIWHSTMAVVDHINRPRTPKDYHNIIANTLTRGANDPCSFAVRLSGLEYVGLISSAQQVYEKHYADILERRQVFARQLALDSKIERSEVLLKMKDKEQKKQFQKDLQRALEKKLRKTTKSEKGWARRYHMSTLLEVQGNWERRRDDRQGMVFFHQIPLPPVKGQKYQPEKYLETCQWNVPAAWDGDALHAADDDNDDLDSLASSQGATKQLARMNAFTGGRGGAARLNEQQHEDARGSAFEEPSETWIPGEDEDEAFTTPGVQPKQGGLPSKKDLALPLPNNNKSGKVGGFRSGSVIAEESLAESSAPTIDTANLEHIAEQLVSSDELMRVLAKRLGLDVSKVVPAHELNSVFSIDQATESVDQTARGAILAPRDVTTDDINEPEIDSDEDLWSDDEIAAGDMDEDAVGALPQDHGEMAASKRQKWRESHTDTFKASTAPTGMPFLNLIDNHISSKSVEASIQAMGWRRLPRPDITKKFFDKCVQKRTLGPDKGGVNTLNTPIFLIPLSPVDACQYVPENFTASYESIFIPDSKKDIERALATLERNLRREEELAKNIPTDDLLLFGEVKGSTIADGVIVRQYDEDQAAFKDPKEVAIDKAIWAAKANNIPEMEDAFCEDIHFDTTDQFGNSLLMLAAQQGSKQMCKFLLRRGASINWQNTSGNTSLHYCFAYNNADLGEYLIKKGADDSILNVDGMTCYEGLTKGDLKEDDGEYL